MIDFAKGAADVVAPVSAGFDPERPFLFEGLAPRFATRTIRSCFITMRDGVGLSMDLHVPLGADMPLPVVLTRTPYGKRNVWPALQALYPEQGFVYAVQDVRGRYESEGEFVACTGQDRDDGHDTVTWLAAQPWCNGAIGAHGTSYSGETAAKLAATRHPNHRASIIMYDGSWAGGAAQNGAFLQGGVAMLRGLFMWFRDYVPKISYGPPAWVDRQAWFRSPAADAYASQPTALPPVDTEAMLRTLPVIDMLDRCGSAPSEFDTQIGMAGRPGDAYWRAQGFLSDADRIDSPGLHVTGPQETGGSGASLFQLFRRIAVSARARDGQYLLFTPCPHSSHALSTADSWIGARHYGDTRFPYYRHFIDWFDHWLRTPAALVPAWPRARTFVAGRNAWDDMADFPAPDAVRVPLYLGADGALTMAPGAPGHATYRYDPSDPTPSEPIDAGKPLVGVGFADRRSLAARDDVLAFRSAVLAAAVELVGAVSLQLYVSSSAVDTDFAAVLVEITPDGAMLNVTHGISRMRFRHGLDTPRPLVPGEVTTITIDLWFAAIAIPAGSRIGLHIASAHFPSFDRNLNTGGDNHRGTVWVVANNSVHYGAGQASALVLPVRGGEVQFTL